MKWRLIFIFFEAKKILKIRIFPDLLYGFFITSSKTFFDDQRANGDANRQRRRAHLGTGKHLQNGSLQVVVNQNREDTPKELKSLDMCIKKGLLTLAGIASDKMLPGVLRPHT